MASRIEADDILAHLHHVTQERARRTANASLAGRVRLLKAYQQQRFSATHADLLASPRYGAASRFFLDHLYGPGDFSSRDEQFARVVPAMIRLFPAEVVETVADLAELHAISERLDTRMAEHLPDDNSTIHRHLYVQAWQATGERPSRQRQIDLSVRIGKSLDRLTRNPLLRHSLRMMRGPAKAAGLTELQKFLEAGFDAFRSMRGAQEFLQLIQQREEALAQALDDATLPLPLELPVELARWMPP